MHDNGTAKQAGDSISTPGISQAVRGNSDLPARVWGAASTPYPPWPSGCRHGPERRVRRGARTPSTAPDLLAPPAHAHIAATGLLRVAGGTRLSWARLLGGARAPSQRDLAGPVHLSALKRLRASLPDNADLARLAACHGVGAGLWLSAFPAPGRPAGAMDGWTMRMATRLWLGVRPVARTAVARQCACGAAVDAYGVHFQAACSAVSCISNATFRHNALVARTAGALRAHPQWRDVVVVASSALFSAGTETLRPDKRAVRVQTGGWSGATSPSRRFSPTRSSRTSSPGLPLLWRRWGARRARCASTRRASTPPPRPLSSPHWCGRCLAAWAPRPRTFCKRPSVVRGARARSRRCLRTRRLSFGATTRACFVRDF